MTLATALVWAAVTTAAGPPISPAISPAISPPISPAISPPISLAISPIGVAVENAVRARAELPPEALVHVDLDERRVRRSGEKASTPDGPLVATLPPGDDGIGRVTARLSDGTFVSARVAVSLPTVVTTRRVARGQLLGPGDVSVEFRPVGRRRALADPALVLGLATRRALTAGAPVGETSLIRPRIVSARERVVATAGRGRLEVSTAAEARQGGAVGEDIQVRILATGRVVRARILGPGSVEVR